MECLEQDLCEWAPTFYLEPEHGFERLTLQIWSDPQKIEERLIGQRAEARVAAILEGCKLNPRLCRQGQ